MNKSKIDWTDYIWNPVTGCKHNCYYCYANRFSKRFAGDVRLNKSRIDDYYKEKGLYILDKPFITRENRSLNYPFGFEPTLHKYRLDLSSKIKNGRNIFVGSMCDLFGEWVPDEWIRMVFEKCKEYAQHNYLFLTKNPKRYKEIISTRNMWFGTTISSNDDIEKAFELLNNTTKWANKFLSIEPLFGEISLNENELLLKEYKSKITLGNYIDWVIVGAQTGPKAKEPKKEWVQAIIEQCREANIPIFLKDNLKWSEKIQEFPDILKRQINVEDNSESAWYQKMISKCAMCKDEKKKKEMIAILARDKRGNAAKQIAYICTKKGCKQKTCEKLGVSTTKLDF